MNDIIHAIEEMGRASTGSDVWHPERFDAAADETYEILGRLIDAGLVHAVHDPLPEQLRNLMEICHPEEEDPPDDRLDVLAGEHLGRRDPMRYGTWVYYPWSQRLVHVLPEEAFLDVRLSRNRNKITPEEQLRLFEQRIGIAGLSVGQASALALATEGIGRSFRLADPDRLDLSNLNRLRGGVHDVGVNKALLAARALFELDPYLDIEVLPEGVTDENLDAFLDGLDLLVEECDDLYMKIRLREAARHRRIPVIMDTSDRGLLDVERFDREPDRPVLHGLVGDLEAKSLVGLSTKDKVPYVLDLLGGADAVSTRLAASMVEIRETLTSWPQLASDVLLGSALCADAARRIVLGRFHASGRYYVDVDRLVSDDAGVHLAPREETAPEVDEAPEAPQVARATGRPTRDELRTVAHYGVLAPSGGNCQPWRIVADGDRLVCIHEVSRSESFLDFEHRASYLAFGALVENMAIAASQMGLAAAIEAFPDPRDRTRVCEVRLSRDGSVRPDPLFSHLAERATNRRLGPRVPLPDDARSALHEAAVTRGGRLDLLEDEGALGSVADLLARGDRLRFLSPVMHREMMSEIRWTPEEARKTRDGIDVGTLELGPADRAGMQITRSYRVMDLVGRFGGGGALGKPTRKAVAAASAVGAVTSPGTAPEDAFPGGRALQRVWLTASAKGLAFQPLTAIVYLFIRLAAGGEGLTEAERTELTALSQAYDALLPTPEGHSVMMLFRVSKAGPPSVRALRRPVEEVLTFAD